MNKEVEQVFNKYEQIVRDNKDGKTICFISRGEWADPQVAWGGYILNYYDVESFACSEHTEDYEPSNQEWLCACMDLYFALTECGEEPDKFTVADALSVTQIIRI